MKRSAWVIWLLLLSLVIAFLFSACGEKNQRLVARVAGKRITTKQFLKSFAQNKKTNQVRQATLEEKKKHLEKLINDALKLTDAYQSGFDEDTTLLQRVSDREKTIMFRRLVDKEIVEKIIPESRIKDYYRKASTEVKIRQIVLRYNPKISNSRSRALQRARSIVRKLKSGDKFSSLAKKESEDGKTAKNGGILGYLKWGPKSYKNPIYVAAFNMKQDEISDPIEHENAFYIIKVVHVKKYPAPPYEQQKEQIRQSVYRVHYNEIEDAFNNYLLELKRKYHLESDKKVMDLFLNKINKKLENRNDKKKYSTEVYKKFSAKDLSQVIATLLFRKITIKDVLDKYILYPRHRRPKFRTLDDVKTFLEERVANEFMLDKEIDAKNMRKDPVVKEQLRRFKESLLLQKAYQERVTKKLNLTEDDYKKYFEENRESFKNPAMREVQEIYVNSKQLADKVVNLARSGQNFTRLFNKYNEKESLKKNKGKLGFISNGRAGIGKPAFNVEIGGVTEPIKIGKGYSIIKVLSEKPPTLKTYDEAKRIVAARLRRIKKDELEKQWLDSLRKKYNVVIYEEALKQAGKNFVGLDITIAN